MEQIKGIYITNSSGNLLLSINYSTEFVAEDCFEAVIYLLVGLLVRPIQLFLKEFANNSH